MNKDVHIQYDFLNSSWKTQREKWHEYRTNTPYKIIINNGGNNIKNYE